MTPEQVEHFIGLPVAVMAYIASLSEDETAAYFAGEAVSKKDEDDRCTWIYNPHPAGSALYRAWSAGWWSTLSPELLDRELVRLLVEHAKDLEHVARRELFGKSGMPTGKRVNLRSAIDGIREIMAEYEAELERQTKQRDQAAPTATAAGRASPTPGATQ